MRSLLYILLTCILTPLDIIAQGIIYQALPNQDQLSSTRVLYLMEDSEGFLWYATEGGGICRNDGRQVDIFRRSDVEENTNSTKDKANKDHLRSNNVGCLEEMGNHIIIGSFNGAYQLDKRDYTIFQIPEVDENRIDDILVTRQGTVYLTSNKKIYEFSYSVKDKKHPFILKATYPSHWKGNNCYVSHLYEDMDGNIWATQWGGGLIEKVGASFKEARWPMNCIPSDVASDPKTGKLWVGTIGQGIVLFDPDNGTVEPQPQTGQSICIDLQLSVDKKQLWMTTIDDFFVYDIGKQLTSVSTDSFMPKGQKVLNRISHNRRGQMLVAGSKPGPFAIGRPTQPWYEAAITDGDLKWEYRERQGVVAIETSTGREHFIHSPGGQLQDVMAKKIGGGIWATDGQRLLSCNVDSTSEISVLSSRPSAMYDDGNGGLWIALNDEVRRFDIKSKKEETAITDISDISAITFTPDGTLWLGTIFGKVYYYKYKQLNKDDYAENEYGDGIVDMRTDSSGNLVIVYDRYIRIYDTVHHTLRQQSREADGTYIIELQETSPKGRWSHPNRKIIVEQIPSWLTSWWMCCIYLLFLCFVAWLIYRNYLLNRQRDRFFEKMKAPTPPRIEETKQDTGDNMPYEKEEESVEQQDKSEKELLDKAIAQVEKNLSNEHYTVEMLSSDLCMSRMTFYRKIQSLTGQKPNEFIRTIRLRRAAELIREGNMTITEISYATGFSSVSYFSRCFRTMYGVPPTQFT